MTENKTEPKKNEASQATAGVIVLMVLGVAFSMDMIDYMTPDDEPRQQAHAQTTQRNTVHPSSSNIVEVGRNYVFSDGYVAMTRDDLRQLDNLFGNTQALMANAEANPNVEFLSGSMVVTVVRREGGITSGMHVQIQTSSGLQFWTVLEFLSPVRQ